MADACASLAVALEHDDACAQRQWCHTHLRASNLNCVNEEVVRFVMADAVFRARAPVVRFLCESPHCGAYLAPAASATIKLLVYNRLGLPHGVRRAMLRCLFSAPAVDRERARCPHLADALSHAVTWNDTTVVELMCVTEARLRRLVPPSAIVFARQAAVHMNHAHLLRRLFAPHVRAAAVRQGETHTERQRRRARWLAHAAQHHFVDTMVALGEVVPAWSTEALHRALTVAARCLCPAAIRVLCGPPFHVAVYCMEPSPLVDAASYHRVDVLAALLEAPRWGGVARSADVVATVVQTALENPSLRVLRLCFDSSIMADLIPATVLRTAVATLARASASWDAGYARRVAAVALACLREMPGGDDAAMTCPGGEGLEWLAAQIKATPWALRHELWRLSRWRQRRTLLCLRRLREAGRATCHHVKQRAAWHK